MEELLAHFPKLDARQRERFARLDPLYREWNARINVVSRKDIDSLYKHHVLHSLALARLIELRPGARVLDLGTGGGFPGVPLAILYPEVEWTLIDGTNKKLAVVREVAEALGLDNVTVVHTRAEDYDAGRRRFDFVVTRAVAALPQLWSWARPLLATTDRHSLPNGLIAWKGGTDAQLREELQQLHRSVYWETFPIRAWFREEWFWEKYLVYCN